MLVKFDALFFIPILSLGHACQIRRCLFVSDIRFWGVLVKFDAVLFVSDNPFCSVLVKFNIVFLFLIFIFGACLSNSPLYFPFLNIRVKTFFALERTCPCVLLTLKIKSKKVQKTAE